jgi:hypothetical protein
MRAVTAPLQPGQQGPDVADLQEALALFIERGSIQLSDGERTEILKQLDDEREAQRYGRATRHLVRLFRVAFRSDDHDFVDDATAAAMNTVLRELGALGEPQPLVVSGSDKLVILDPVGASWDSARKRTALLVENMNTDGGPAVCEGVSR